MKDEERFETNLARWALFCPVAAKALKSDLADGSVSGGLDEESQLSHFQSATDEDLSHEAEEWVQEVDLQGCEVLYIYGVGFGHLFESLKEWLSNPNHFLVFIEDDLSIIAALLKSERGSQMMAHPQVWLHYLDASHSRLSSLTNLFAVQKPHVDALPLYKKLRAEKFRQLKVEITFIVNLQRNHLSEYQSFGKQFFTNYFNNLFAWPSAYLGDGLIGKFPSVPAIICGAGPSLAKNIDLLAKLKDKALIFAGGTAMNALNANGTMPHFGVGIDPNSEQLTRIIMNKAYDVPFFYRSRMYHGALDLVSGDRLYISGNAGYDLADYFDKEIGIVPTDVEEGCNVINMSLSIAEKMGCNPIILVGVDLAYSDDQSYAPGILNHPIHVGKKLFRTKEQSEELILQPDINGKPIYTLWKWVSESLWFSDYASRFPHLKVINATEGGIGFSDIPNRTLASVADEFLTHQQDLQGRVFSEIQNHPMPAIATTAFVMEKVETFARSLATCISIIKNALQQPVDGYAQVSNHNNSEKVAEPSLHEELAYRYLLKKFDEAFDSSHERERWRLDNDGLSAEEREKRRKNLDMRRLHYACQAGLVVQQIIEWVLQKHRAQPQGVPAGAAGAKAEVQDAEGTFYSFEAGKFTLIDPEFDLHHIEEFIPDVFNKEQEVDALSGAVKCQCFRRGGKLHGPSSFYGPQGQLLMRSWYIDGALEGKALQYYPSGILRAIQRFRRGVRHGKQESYYENGFLRSLLHFKNGSLHGEVMLVHDNGVQARTLTFIEGKRNGVECIWNREGLLTIEAHFKNDLPIDKAFVWHDNGTLAQEITYGPMNEVVEAKRWKQDGAAIEKNQWEHFDYFENIAAQTGVLADSLSNIVKKMGGLLPAEVAEVPIFEKEFLELNKELVNLQSLHEKMMYESGADQKNQQEAIWKTPSLQRELQMKLDAMTEQMHGEIAKLQESLHATVEELLQKQKAHEDPPPES